jgi:hypothetical protein
MTAAERSLEGQETYLVDAWTTVDGKLAPVKERRILRFLELDVLIAAEREAAQQGTVARRSVEERRADNYAWMRERSLKQRQRSRKQGRGRGRVFHGSIPRLLRRGLANVRCSVCKAIGHCSHREDRP